jgi:hypothetical protein
VNYFYLFFVINKKTLCLCIIYILYNTHYTMISLSIFRTCWIFYVILTCSVGTIGQTTNICGNVDCSVRGNLPYSDLCKKPTDIRESTRNQICGSSYSSCSGIGCRTLCNCKVYNVANCCYSGKQCTSDFVKVVCGSLG